MHDFIITADHPALPGHFPGQPVVPGVVIAERVIDLLAAAQPGLRVAGIRKLKFLRPLLPGERVLVSFAAAKDGHLRFQCHCGGALLAEGRLELAP